MPNVQDNLHSVAPTQESDFIFLNNYKHPKSWWRCFPELPLGEFSSHNFESIIGRPSHKNFLNSTWSFKHRSSGKLVYVYRRDFKGKRFILATDFNWNGEVELGRDFAKFLEQKLNIKF